MCLFSLSSLYLLSIVLEIVSDFDFGFRSFPASVCVCQLAGADGHFEIIMRLDVSADSIWMNFQNLGYHFIGFES
jgi:hypothetical protein